jgi:two-component system nitrate/nitrite sensor histidine kinase NarX
VQGVMQSNEPVLLGNVVGEFSSTKKTHAGNSVRAIMAAPLSTAPGSALGVMLAGSRKAQSFNTRQLAVLQSIAGQVALVLNTANQMADVQYQSMMNERTRLAREIHDGLAQTLGFLKLQMSQMQGYLDRQEMDRLDKAMKVIYQTLSDAYQEARYAIDGLRISPEDSGYTWVDQILGEFNENTAGDGPEAVLVENKVDVPIAPEIQAQLIRILQEALSNVRKHAQASRVRVSFCEEDGDVVLEVQDNGVGFSSAEVAGPSRHGLRGMRERADLIGADFQVMSRPEKGTTVRVSLPVRQGELEK